MNWELPQGWANATIGDVAEGMKNGLYKPASFYAENGIACLRMYNIDGGKIIWRDIKRMELTPEEIQEYQLLAGDLLVNRVNSRELVGKSAIIPDDIERCVFESKNIRLRLRRDMVCPELVNYKLLLSGSQHFIHNAQQVVGMASISQPQVSAFELPLPPLAEQRRIVAKLEKLQIRVDACRRRLSRIPMLLKRFRQSVLTAACSGRLTADWRDKNETKSVEPEFLIDLKQNSKLFESLQRGHRFDSSNPFDWEEFPELPVSWCWVAAAEVVEPQADIVYGIVQPGPEVPDGVPYVRGLDIQNGRILLDQLRRTSRVIAKKYERASLRSGDVLLGIIRNTKVAIVPESLAGGNITQGTARLRPSRFITTEFLAFWLESKYAQDWLHLHYRGIDMPGLNLADVRKLPIPLPPRPEQEEIARRTVKLLALADQIEMRLAEAQRRTDSLAQSILAKAFRGELVPTEYELAQREGRPYESASELLARIRTVSDANSDNGTRSTRKRRNK